VLTSHVKVDGLATFESLLVNVTFHETVASASTLTAVLVVGPTDAGDAALARVKSCELLLTGYSLVPEVAPQLSPEYRVNDTVPLRAVPPAEVIVAESFGSQVWWVVADDVSVTVRHSPLDESVTEL